MSLVEEVHGCGASMLSVCGHAMTEACSGTTGADGDELTQFAKGIRDGVGVVASLVHVYLAGAIRYKV